MKMKGAQNLMICDILLCEKLYQYTDQMTGKSTKRIFSTPLTEG